MAKATPMEPEGPDATDTDATPQALDPKAEARARRKAEREQKKATREAMGGNKPWFLPTMLGLMIFGLLWVVVYYLSAGHYPVASWGNWNLGFGFGFIMAGFIMTTQWK